MARNIGIAFELGGVHAPIAKKTQKGLGAPRAAPAAFPTPRTQTKPIGLTQVGAENNPQAQQDPAAMFRRRHAHRVSGGFFFFV